MKKIKVIKRISAILFMLLIAVSVMGCGESKKPDTMSDLQSKAKTVSKTEAEKVYKEILDLLEKRANLIPEFVEKEKDHSSIKYSEEELQAVYDACKVVEEAKTVDEYANACNEVDEAIFHWLMNVNSLNPNLKDECYTALFDEVSATTRSMVSLIGRYNNAVKSYNAQVSKKDHMESFDLPASDLVTSEDAQTEEK